MQVYCKVDDILFLNIKETTMEYYNRYATKVAPHAWKKSKTRKTYVVSCIYSAIKKHQRTLRIKPVLMKYKLLVKDMMRFHLLFFRSE